VPEIKGNEIRYVEQIGKGCFGTVFLGECRGKTVAVKKLNTQRFDKKALEEFKKEVAVFTCVAKLFPLLTIKASSASQCCFVYGCLH
jgi:predicted Ser/Thr protein kinase